MNRQLAAPTVGAAWVREDEGTGVMTFLGKIFTVLIFIMSLVFMSFAVAVYMTQRNWRDYAKNEVATEEKPLGLEPQLKQAMEKNDELRAEKEKLEDKLKMETAARRTALASLEAHRQQLIDRLAVKERENKDLVARERAAIAELNTAHVSLTGLQEEVAVLRGDIVATQQDRDLQFRQVVDLTDRIHQARGVRRRLEERRDQLTEEVGLQKKVLRAHGLTKDTPLDNRPPKLEGVVLAVSAKSGLVEVSIGSDDGLRDGHQLEMFNKGRYLGRINVVKTTPDRAVGEILKEYRKGDVQKGDRVITKTN